MPAETHSQRDLSQDEIRRVVHEQVAELVGVPVEELRDDTLLPEDALALVEVVEALREELAERTVGIDGETDPCSTVGDVIAHVAGHLKVEGR